MGPLTVPDLVTEGSHCCSSTTLAEQHTCQEKNYILNLNVTDLNHIQYVKQIRD